MKDYRTIVVPVDGSDNSKRAVEHAVTTSTVRITRSAQLNMLLQSPLP